MIKFFALVHMLNATQLVWGGWGGWGGGMITFFCTCTHVECYATCLGWVGWGDDNVSLHLPKLGSVATNRFVYRKLLGGLGGFYPVPFGVPLWVSFTDFGFCIRKFTNLSLGSCNFQTLMFSLLFAALCRFHFSLSLRCHLFQDSCFYSCCSHAFLFSL